MKERTGSCHWFTRASWALVTALAVDGCGEQGSSATPSATGASTAALEAPRDPSSTALPTSPDLLNRLKAKFKPPCKLRQACGHLLGIDCDSAADGPFYYVDATSLETVSTCGGACMRGCTNCPPKEWTCK